MFERLCWGLKVCVVWDCKYLCMCVLAFEMVYESLCVCVCVCVYSLSRWYMSVCVCDSVWFVCVFVCVFVLTENNLHILGENFLVI